MVEERDAALVTEIPLASKTCPAGFEPAGLNLKRKPKTGGDVMPETDGSLRERGSLRSGHARPRLYIGNPDDGPRGSGDVEMNVSGGGRGQVSETRGICLDSGARYDGRALVRRGGVGMRGDRVEVNALLVQRAAMKDEVSRDVHSGTDWATCRIDNTLQVRRPVKVGA